MATFHHLSIEDGFAKNIDPESDMKRDEVKKFLHGTLFTGYELDMLSEKPDFSIRTMKQIRSIKRMYPGAFIQEIGPAGPEWDLGDKKPEA
jgi:hypothetical protein